MNILFVPHKKHITSPVGAQQVNALYTFVCTSQETYYLSVTTQSHFATDARSVGMSSCRAPSGAHDQMFVNCFTVTVLSYSGALSDERSDPSFVSHSLKSLSICNIYLLTFCMFDVLCIQNIQYIQALCQSRLGTAPL
jgi:hypothetical protein